MNTLKQKYNCTDFEQMINENLEGTLSSEKSLLLNTHLQTCKDCTKYLEDINIILKQLSKLPREIMPKKDLWSAIELKISPAVQSNGSPIEASAKKSEDKFTYIKQHFNFKHIFTGLAAAIILFGLIYTIALYNKRETENNLNTDVNLNVGIFWKLNNLQGTTSVSGKPVTNTDSITEGAWIVTDTLSKAEIKLGNIGSVIIEPGSKVRVLNTAAGNKRLGLEYGSLDVKVETQPKTFFVETPSATAVDLGCSYKITVDSSGDGILFVRSGMVSLQSDKRESLVPAGKYCITKKDFGPGTPFREDISPEMKNALMQFDFGECASSCIKTIVKHAQKSDAVTLLNILPRADKQYKPIIYEKVAYFCPPPKKIPYDSIPKLDNLESLNDWIVVIIENVHKNIEENMKDIDKHIRMQIDKDFEYKFDSNKWAKEWKEEMKKNRKKWDKFKFHFNSGDTAIDYHFSNSDTASGLDKEQFKKDMEELQKELKEMNIEIEKNNEEIKIEMKKLMEDLKNMNIELQEQLREQLQEVDDNVKKQLKNIDIQFKDTVDASDSTSQIIIKVKKDKLYDEKEIEDTTKNK